MISLLLRGALLGLLLWPLGALAQPTCKGTKQLYEGKCLYPDEISALKAVSAKRPKAAKVAIKAAPVSLEWVRVQGGSFMMGQLGEPDEQPERPISIETFELSRTEVTAGQYAACVAAKACKPPKKGLGCTYGGPENLPINCVTQAQAAQFAAWVGGRLPTEAEWEYAARAGTRTDTYAGPLAIKAPRSAPVLELIAWYGGNSGVEQGGVPCADWEGRTVAAARCGPHAVGQKLPNARGLFDMLGNVWEWTADQYLDYRQAPTDGRPAVVIGGKPVRRGGGFRSEAREVRSAKRGGLDAPQSDDTGFRVARGHLETSPIPAGIPDLRGWSLVLAVKDPRRVETLVPALRRSGLEVAVVGDVGPTPTLIHAGLPAPALQWLLAVLSRHTSLGADKLQILKELDPKGLTLRLNLPL